MARTLSSDYYQNFAFFMEATPPADAGLEVKDFLAESDQQLGEAGFKTCGIPELSTESTTYREGHFKFERKQPGISTWNDITAERGLMRNGRALFNWAIRHLLGDEYRADVTIYHWHRAGKVPGLAQLKDKSSRFKLADAFPIRCKLASDLDATASDISTSELDIAYEDCEKTLADGTVLN